jgi:AraC-like DNA-binding protein
MVNKELKYKGEVVFNKLIIPTPKRTLKPFKNNEACFMFVNDGSFSIRTPDKLYSFNKEIGMITKCFNFYFESTKEQRIKNETIEIIGVYFFPSIVEEILDINLYSSNHTVDFNIKQVQLDEILNQYRKSINLLLDNPEFVDDELIKTKLKEFILLMVKTLDLPSQIDFLASLYKPINIEFKTTIENNLYVNLSINELAKLCHLSVSSFKRQFKSVYNDSPKRYFCKKKVEKAASLLKGNNMRISEIAYIVGFDSMATFNRNFNLLLGMSPTKYRLS